jgi:hypothetical protein
VGVLTRKISRAKWHAEDLAKGEIPADALSADLRTAGNILSFWSGASAADSDVARAVLAIAAAADRLDRMDVAWIDESVVEKHGIDTAVTPGRTPIESLQTSHVDLIHLDVKRLGTVAELISAAIERGDHRRMTKKQIVVIMVEAVHDHVVALDDLPPRVREAVQKSLNRAG